MKRFFILPLALIFLVTAGAPAAAQETSSPGPGPDTLAARIQRITERPEFRHAFFGIEFYSLDSGQPLYSLNAEKLFTPASTTKLLTEGTARTTGPGLPLSHAHLSHRSHRRLRHPRR